MRATKIFKNNGSLRQDYSVKTIYVNSLSIYCQFMDIFGAAATFHLGIAR